jgi:UDP-glucose 4-epimerase
MLKSYCVSKDWTVIILRYFNPAGAHSSGLLGEDPNDTPNNLIPYILKVAVGKMPYLEIYGNDYETPDGFCVRDFIHVMDVAEGHVVALDKIQEDGIHIYNLGTGKGTSVMELVETFQRTNGIKISYKICPRRPGDVAESYADVSKAEHQLGWTATRTPQDICRDAYFYVLQSNRKGI